MQADVPRLRICDNPSVLLRTPQDALELLRRDRVLTLTPAGRLRSLVGEIAGEVRGSWWGHPEVEREGTLRLEGRAPARLDLEKRGLVLAASEHTDSGRHAVVLRSWEDWAPAALRKKARLLDFAQALAELRSAGLTL